jgi:hypothetical protein
VNLVLAEHWVRAAALAYNSVQVPVLKQSMHNRLGFSYIGRQKDRKITNAMFDVFHDAREQHYPMVAISFSD